MPTIEPQDEEVSEASTSEVGDASDGSESDALIMAEMADADLDQELSEREALIGARKEMGPPIDWESETSALEALEANDIDEGQELTPPPLAED